TTWRSRTLRTTLASRVRLPNVGSSGLLRHVWAWSIALAKTCHQATRGATVERPSLSFTGNHPDAHRDLRGKLRPGHARARRSDAAQPGVRRPARGRRRAE